MKKSILSLVLAGLALSAVASAKVVLDTSASNLSTSGSLKATYKADVEKSAVAKAKRFSYKFKNSGDFGFATNYVINDDLSASSVVKFDFKPSTSTVELGKAYLKLSSTSLSSSFSFGKTGGVDGVDGSSLNILGTSLNDSFDKAKSNIRAVYKYSDDTFGFQLSKNLGSSTDKFNVAEFAVSTSYKFSLDDTALTAKAAYSYENQFTVGDKKSYGAALTLSLQTVMDDVTTTLELSKVLTKGGSTKVTKNNNFGALVDLSYKAADDLTVFVGGALNKEIVGDYSNSSASDIKSAGTIKGQTGKLLYTAYAGALKTVTKGIDVYGEVATSEKNIVSLATGVKFSY